jgi:hypothetical protein
MYFSLLITATTIILFVGRITVTNGQCGLKLEMGTGVCGGLANNFYRAYMAESRHIALLVNYTDFLIKLPFGDDSFKYGFGEYNNAYWKTLRARVDAVEVVNHSLGGTLCLENGIALNNFHEKMDTFYGLENALTMVMKEYFTQHLSFVNDPLDVIWDWNQLYEMSHDESYEDQFKIKVTGY